MYIIYIYTYIIHLLINMDIDEDIEAIEKTISEPSNIKKYLIMIILFIIIVSNIFQENFLTMFGNTIYNGKITFWGTIIQATLFTIIYTLLMHLVDISVI